MVYDLFISFKSEDVLLAKKIREELLLRKPELKIFWSEITLSEIGNSDYTKVIEDAIISSKNMCVVGNSIENITSKWVMYEWRLFKHCQLNDKKDFYNNLFLAISDFDIAKLPITLQLCECLNVSDYDSIYQYIAKSNNNNEKKNVERTGLDVIQEMLNQLGWQSSLLLSPSQLSNYELSVQNELETVMIISHQLLHDSPGGALFETVESNLKKGIEYNYIFFDSMHAYSVLRKIYKGHSLECRNKLLLEMAEESLWIFGKYVNLTIYEFKNGRAPEGYFRVLMEPFKGVETAVFLRVTEEFIDLILNNIENYRLKGLIRKYGGTNNES